MFARKNADVAVHHEMFRRRGETPERFSMAVTETDKLNRANVNAIDAGGARAIVFDRRWDFNVSTIRGWAELRVLQSQQNQQNQQYSFCYAAGVMGFVPLQYDVDINGDRYRELSLPSDCKLLVDVANFRTSRRQCTFDLLIELKLPVGFLPPVRIFNDTIHIAVPTSGMVDDQLRAQLPSLANFNIADLQRALSLASSTSN
jgi:hypothetical protein